MIDVVAARFRVSAKEIYLAGLSAGAVFSHYLANRRPFSTTALSPIPRPTPATKESILEPAVKGPQVRRHLRLQQRGLQVADRLLHRIGAKIPPVRLPDGIAKDLSPPWHQVVGGKTTAGSGGCCKNWPPPLTRFR